MISYSTRKNAFTGTQTFALDQTGLDIIEDKRSPQRILLADIICVRLEFHPTRFETERYRCEIRTRQNKQWEFFNRSYEGVASFRDTSTEYAQFVRELHAALPRVNPGCQFVAGCTGARYWINVAAMVFTALVLMALLAFLVMVGMHWIALLKMLLIAAFTPVAIQWLRRNRPRRYQPTAIPEEVLPATANA